MKGLYTLATLALVVVTLTLLAGCGFIVNGVRGSGRTETRTMDLANFTEIDGSGAFQIQVQQGSSFAVAVTADDNLWNYLDVRVVGQTLRLGLKQPGSYTFTHLSAKITMPALNGVSASGATQVTLAGFAKSAGNLTVKASGASKVSGDTQADNAIFDLSGASSATLRGAAMQAQVVASGASHAELKAFPVDRASVTLSGASSAKMSVKSAVDYDLSGASNLSYTGSPTIGKSQTSGSSNATKE